MDKNLVSVATFDRNAELYVEKFMDVSAYSEPLEKLCSMASNGNATVLDMACGPGNLTNYLLNKQPDLDVLGIDLAPAMVHQARLQNPHAKFEVMDCRKLKELHEEFDILVCGFLLPYLSEKEAKELIVDFGHLILANGLIYLSFIEGDYSQSSLRTSSKGDKAYQYFYQEGQVISLLEKAGFRVLHVYRVSINGVDEDVIILARRQS